MSYERPRVQRVQLLGAMQAAPSCPPDRYWDPTLQKCVLIN